MAKVPDQRPGSRALTRLFAVLCALLVVVGIPLVAMTTLSDGSTTGQSLFSGTPLLLGIVFAVFALIASGRSGQFIAMFSFKSFQLRIKTKVNRQYRKNKSKIHKRGKRR